MGSECVCVGGRESEREREREGERERERERRGGVPVVGMWSVRLPFPSFVQVSLTAAVPGEQSFTTSWAAACVRGHHQHGLSGNRDRTGMLSAGPFGM